MQIFELRNWNCTSSTFQGLWGQRSEMLWNFSFIPRLFVKIVYKHNLSLKFNKENGTLVKKFDIISLNVPCPEFEIHSFIFSFPEKLQTQTRKKNSNISATNCCKNPQKFLEHMPLAFHMVEIAWLDWQKLKFIPNVFRNHIYNGKRY